MTTPPLRVERRAGQRFQYLLPLSLRQPVGSIEGVGFTQDLSSRGVFFFTDAPLTEGAEIELTLKMPSEITLGETSGMQAFRFDHAGIERVHPDFFSDRVPWRAIS